MLRLRYIITVVVALILFAVILFRLEVFPISLKPDTDLEAIKKRGYLTLVTVSNPTGYFMYKNTPMGFEYDLIHAFASDLGIELKVLELNHPEDMYQKLLTGEADIMAYHIPVSNLPMKFAIFSDPYLQTELVLIQRSRDKKSPHYIDKISDLAGKTITVSEKSPFVRTLTDIQFELNGSLKIQTIDTSQTSEDLIRMVADSEIDYTVASREIALINKDYYNNIDISATLTPPQDIAFTIHRKHRKLAYALNKFISASRKNQYLYSLYEKYFQTDRILVQTKSKSDSAIPSDSKGISIFDGLIQRYAEKTQWDWRLIAAMIKQESGFNPTARSWAGAMGLMQLMPGTAKKFGLHTYSEIYHPELNIQTGTKYIVWLEDFWKDIQDDIERKKFILASYNAGQGHIRDAQRLARKYGYNPQKWDGHVEYFILNKSKPVFYMDPVSKHGYCRGSETFNYVRSIIKIYSGYKNKYPAGHTASYDFSLDFAPVYEFGFGTTEQGTGLVKKPLFQKNEIFRGRNLIESDSGQNYNHLKPKNPERIQLRKNAPPSNQLFKKNELFKKNS